MTVEQFELLGFPDARTIYVSEGSYLPGLKPETLLKFGRKVAGGWEVDPPRSGNISLWRRLLDSDMPIVVEPPSESIWLERVIASLHAPIIYVNENPCLSSKAHTLCRRLLKPETSGVVIAFGLYRETFSFFGKGDAFEAACDAMAERPQALLDHTDDQRRALIRAAFKLVRQKNSGPTVPPPKYAFKRTAGRDFDVS